MSNNELANTDSWLSRNLPSAIKYNAITAISTGLYGTIIEGFNIPINLLKNVSENIKLRGELKRKILERAATLKTNQLDESEDLIDRALNYQKLKLLDEQINRETIAAKAINNLNNTHQAQPIEENTIDEDWLTAFWDIAKNKTDEDVRNMLSKILSNEIVYPGSISIYTLQALSVLDSELGNAFQNLVNLSIDDGSLCYVIHPNLGVFMSAGELDKYGISFGDQLYIDGANLIQSSTSNLVKIQSTEVDFAGEKYYLEAENHQLHIIVFTQVGRELRRLMDKMPNENYVADVNDRFKKEILKKL